MENASKALLIAGAVLIVILLIGIGMLIYSRSTGVIDTAASTMNTQEIQSFNSQFTPYEGSQKGSSVRAMIATVIANNGTYALEDSKKVRIHFSSFSINNLSTMTNYSNSEILSKISASINTSDTYQITFTGYSNGLISQIRISK